MCQLLAELAKSEKDTSITVTSHSLPHLKRGAMRDFETVLSKQGWYDEGNINKTDHIYSFGKSYVEFFSSDSSEKVRGPGRKILFMNEANLNDYETFRQMLLRTEKTIFLDYNPADEYHWLYDKVLTRPDCKLIQSCYLDNFDFLPAEQVAEIERLREEDPDYWEVYGLGNRGKSIESIYTNWSVAPFPLTSDVYYGLDFGFNVPCALVEVCELMSGTYVREKIYQTNLTNPELISLMKDVGIRKDKPIYADPEDKNRIQEIRQAGFTIIEAKKDVKDGIDSCKRGKIFIEKESFNLTKEIKSYKWKKDKKTDKVQDEPVKFQDHCMDAMRYAKFTHNKKPKFSWR